MSFNVRGELVENAPIGAQSWFRCGGTADLLFKPADQDDLAAYLKQHDPQKPLTIIGGLANTIIRDGGVRGTVIQLGKAFAEVELIDNQTIKAGTGALNGTLASAATKAGIGGLEFLSGIPGTLGGALRMNAGAYGSDISDILVEINALDFAGNPFILTPHPNKSDDQSIAEKMQINLSYRNNDAPHYLIFTSATLKGTS